MSRQIQGRQHTHKSGFTITATNKYMVEIRYRQGATGLNTWCRPWSKPTTHSSPTPPQPKHRYASNTPPAPTGLVKSKPYPLIHSPTLLLLFAMIRSVVMSVKISVVEVAELPNQSHWIRHRSSDDKSIGCALQANKCLTSCGEAPVSTDVAWFAEHPMLLVMQ